MIPLISNETLNFLKDNREKYRWPLSDKRSTSEKVIEKLRNEAQMALTKKDPAMLKKVLIKVHRWKTGGRTTNLYRISLNNEMELINKIFSFFPLKERFIPDSFENFLDILKVDQCNLPVASAQASFLTNRQTPIIDRFVAQFFSRKVSKSILKIKGWDMRSVFGDIVEISFSIEDDGRRVCVPRLAVYYISSYQRNKSLFVNLLLPELNRISTSLNKMNIKYKGSDGLMYNFLPVDIEMSIFAFGTQNREYFQCFYKGRDIPTLII